MSNKEAFYFSHDSNAHKDEKIRRLRFKHGLCGYGAYWILIELLRDANTYEMQKDYESIAYELHTDSDMIKSIVEDFGLFDYDDEVFWSNSLKNRMKIKEMKSKKAKMAAEARWGKKEKQETFEVVDSIGVNANALHTECAPNAIKEKKRKEIYTNAPECVDEFLDDWNSIRTEILKKPSYLNRLNHELREILIEIRRAYSKEQIKTALKGLFRQQRLPHNNTSMQSSPKHFLNNFEIYLTAGTDMNPSIYGTNE